MRFFGERTQRARKEHFCDRCCDWILPGEEYTRKIWISENDYFYVLKEHGVPECKRLDEYGAAVEEPVRTVLRTILETREVAYVALRANGDSVVCLQATLVARTICVPETSDDLIVDADDVEIPF